MNSKIFTEWLEGLDLFMKKKKRHILLFLDNAPVHPPDVDLQNIKLKFFPANTTALIQPLDQGIIRTFKAYYRRFLVKHVIASSTVAMTADDIKVTALDAVHCIDSAWNAVTETTIRNTFRAAGFEERAVPGESETVMINPSAHEDITIDDKAVEKLDQVLKHLTIGGKTISASDYIVRCKTTCFSIF